MKVMASGVSRMEEMGTPLAIFGAAVGFFILVLALGSFFTVETAQVAIVQRLGKFARVAGPGMGHSIIST